MLRYGRDYDRQFGRGNTLDTWRRAPDRDASGRERYDRELYDRYAGQARAGGMQRQHAGGWMHRYDRELRAGQGRPEPHNNPAPRSGERFTGMESNRYRGVYGSDYRPGGWNRGEHGGYRGEGWNRGGGMNPGHHGGWR
jgi:hypothetical protein